MGMSSTQNISLVRAGGGAGWGWVVAWVVAHPPPLPPLMPAQINVDRQAIARIDVRETGAALCAVPSPPAAPATVAAALACQHCAALSHLLAAPRRRPRPVPPPPPPAPPARPPGSSRMFNWLDYDGSATGRAGPSIVGSWPSWWQLAPDCTYEVGGRAAGPGGRASRDVCAVQGPQVAAPAAADSRRQAWRGVRRRGRPAAGASAHPAPRRPPRPRPPQNTWNSWVCPWRQGQEVGRLELRIPGLTVAWDTGARRRAGPAGPPAPPAVPRLWLCLLGRPTKRRWRCGGMGAGNRLGPKHVHPCRGPCPAATAAPSPAPSHTLPLQARRCRPPPPTRSDTWPCLATAARRWAWRGWDGKERRGRGSAAVQLWFARPRSVVPPEASAERLPRLPCYLPPARCSAEAQHGHHQERG